MAFELSLFTSTSYIETSDKDVHFTELSALNIPQMKLRNLNGADEPQSTEFHHVQYSQRAVRIVWWFWCPDIDF